MSDDKGKPPDSKESDAKGATEDDTRKIGAIDPNDPLGNEQTSAEHSGQKGKREQE